MRSTPLFQGFFALFSISPYCAKFSRTKREKNTRISRDFRALYVKFKQHHVPILHDVLFPFHPIQPLFSGRRH